MASPIAPATPHDRAGSSTPSPADKADTPPFGPLLDSQLAAASVPFAPYPPNTPSTASSNTPADAALQRPERSSPRQGNRRQRK